jgi:hypothetical protein
MQAQAIKIFNTINLFSIDSGNRSRQEIRDARQRRAADMHGGAYADGGV